MKKSLKIFGTVVVGVLVVWLAIFLWPVKERPAMAFFEGNPDVLVIAHRGGYGLAPESTFEAFDNAAQLGADVLEYDLHMTKDGHLVAIHDDTVDRTTDGTGKVNDLMLEEIKALDAGYGFEDEEGNHTFRGQGVQMATLEEIFERYPDMHQLIELKDTNRPDLHEEMIQDAWRLIQEYQMEDKVMIASFDQTINERFEEVSGGKVAIGAGEQAVRGFVTRHVPFLNGIAKSEADALPLPVEAEGFDLTSKNMMNGARKRNMSIYYWTINDAEEMRELIKKGADGIMTNYPDVLMQVLAETK